VMGTARAVGATANIAAPTTAVRINLCIGELL
jgi:hypothetical protein